MDRFSVLEGRLAGVQWTVLSATGDEALSSLFAFTLTLSARVGDDETDLLTTDFDAIEVELLRQPALLRLGDEGVGIDRYSIVVAAHAEALLDPGGEPHIKIRVDLAPRAWLLTQRRVSRIFQHKYVHQIVSEVLHQAGVKHRWELRHTYPKRLYCTQYNETDYEFVCRLLAEEGILFFFEHRGDFAGGTPPATPTPEASDWEKAAEVIGGIAKGARVAGSMLDNDVLKASSAAAAVAADFAKPPPRDEESDDPLVPGAGQAGTGGPGDVLVFVDQAAAYATALDGRADRPDMMLSVSLRDRGELTGSPWEISELVPSRRVRSDRVEVRDYDFRRPMLLLQANAGREVNAADPGAALEVYAHHGEYEKPEVTAQIAGVQLEQHRADALLSAGQGPCPRLSPGHKLNIENAGPSHLPHATYTMVRVRHESVNPGASGVPRPASPETEALVHGCARAIHAAIAGAAPPGEMDLRRMIRQAIAERRDADRSYWCRFECVPHIVAYRPPRPERLPRHVTEVATVVGPEGQDIYTDRYGRVKIQFHWDREGQWLEGSSCWVRVIQPWAGAGFGVQFIPRVGMEVLVAFLAGDPDRPVVLGSLYNATHATPEPLPQRLTRSGIRSQSSPGGGGFNELSFEDQAGVERVYLHAQKDLHEIVNNTHTINVKNSQDINVSGRQQIAAGGDQRIAVGARRTVTVGGDATEHVQGSRTSNVIRNRTDLVQGNALTSVGGMAVRAVQADALTTVEGNHNLSVLGDAITQVGGREDGGKSSAVLFVEGSAFVTATDRVQLKAEGADGAAETSAIRLECGGSVIELCHDRITISAPRIEIRATEVARVAGSDASVTLDGGGARIEADPIEQRTPDGAEVVLDANSATVIGPGGATVQGSTVHLCSGQSTAEQEERTEETTERTPNLKLAFSHLRQTNGGSRVAHTRYQVVVEDLVYEGRTDDNGQLAVWVADTARVAYVVLWANETYTDVYPREGGPLHWLVRLVPEIPSAGSAKGARVRLRNLGYDPGVDLDEEEIDPATAAAILEFQLDQDKTPTGELEDETKQKISEIYGS